jgi:hypothetical protein
VSCYVDAGKADDELPEPYLKGFYWDKEDAYQKFQLGFSKEMVIAPSSSKKSKKKKGDDAE